MKFDKVFPKKKKEKKNQYTRKAKIPKKISIYYFFSNKLRKKIGILFYFISIF